MNLSPGRQRPPIKSTSPLAEEITKSIDHYHRKNDISVKDVLEALEIIRHAVTEGWLAANPGMIPKW